MKYDFTYYNPTRIHFGKDAMSNLCAELKNFGDNVLLLYGKNSVKKIGLYDEVVRILKQCKKILPSFPALNPTPHIHRCLRAQDFAVKIKST